MNSEWANDHVAHVLETDETQDALAQLRDLKIALKEQAVEIERKIKRAAKSPFVRGLNAARQILQMVQK